jgi:hypothetical protein
MSTDTKQTSKGVSIGFSGLLTILFIALKLTGHITWSWLWVLSPLWIGLALVVAIMVIVLIVGIVIAYLSK